MLQPSTSTTLHYIHEQLEVTDSEEVPLHRELTFCDTVPSMGAIAADLAAAQLASSGGVPSRWVAEDSSDDEPDDARGLNGREKAHSAGDDSDDLEDVSLLPDGQLDSGRHLNGNGQPHANGEHHGGVNGTSHDADDGDDESMTGAGKQKSSRLTRAASKGRLVQVRSPVRNPALALPSARTLLAIILTPAFAVPMATSRTAADLTVAAWHTSSSCAARLLRSVRANCCTT